MNNFRRFFTSLLALTLLGFGARIVSSQENPGASSTVQVQSNPAAQIRLT